MYVWKEAYQCWLSQLPIGALITVYSLDSGTWDTFSVANNKSWVKTVHTYCSVIFINYIITFILIWCLLKEIATVLHYQCIYVYLSATKVSQWWCNYSHFLFSYKKKHCTQYDIPLILFLFLRLPLHQVSLVIHVCAQIFKSNYSDWYSQIFCSIQTHPSHWVGQNI